MWYKPEGSRLVTSTTYNNVFDELGIWLSATARVNVFEWLQDQSIFRIVPYSDGYIISSRDSTGCTEASGPYIQMITVNKQTEQVQLVFVTEVSEDCCQKLLEHEISLQLSTFLAGRI